MRSDYRSQLFDATYAPQPPLIDIAFRKFADLHNLCKSHFDGSYGDEMFNRVVEGTKLGLTEHAFLSFVYGYDMSNVQ